MSKKKAKHTSWDVEDQWQTAREYAAMLGDMSNLFSHCVRSLKAEAARKGKGGDDLSRVSRQELERIYHSPTLKAVLYYAVSTYEEEKLQKIKHLSVLRLIDILGHEGLASILAVAYLFRRTRRISDPEKFERIVPTIQTYVDLGGFMGTAIPEIGLARGVLLGGMRNIALSLFLRRKPDAFRDYRLHLKIKNITYDSERELKAWGCTHFQVASVMMQLFGFGIDEARALAEAMDIGDFKRLSPIAKRFRVASLWLDALVTTGRPPASNSGDEYPLDERALAVLEEQIKRILTNGSQYQWLTKSATDINPEMTPQLFHEADRVMMSVLKSYKVEIEEPVADDNFDEIG